VPNEGSAGRYAFGHPRKLKAAGEPIDVPHGDAGPFVADWDGDGTPDLLVGTGAGSVLWYRNTGTGEEPKLVAAQTLVPEGEQAPRATARSGARRGMRAKVCATDWDGDGRLDLLVGDFAMEPAPPAEPSGDEKAAQAKTSKELEELLREHKDLQRPARGETAAAREEREAKLRELGTRIIALVRQRRPSRSPYVYHGRVWLFLRKPAEARAASR
jgi:hypothetical protein